MKNICALPWVGFSNDPNGTVRPCCIYKEHILDSDNKPYFIQKTKVQEIFHSDYMNNLRSEFLAGGKPNGCSVCWEDEKNGYKSKRQSYLEVHKENVDFLSPPDYPLDYQLILTNACNLKCRSCGTSHSTSWIKEFKSMPTSVTDFIQQGPYEMPHGQSGGAESVFIEDIDQWAPKVKRLEIVGGEPFYTNIWENIWNYLIDKGYSKDIVLTMSTNCTIFKPELVKRLVDNFKSVGIGLSIDGIGDIFNFLRKNGDWKEVSKTLLQYYKLYRELNTHKLTLNYTVTTSWINAIILPEMYEWFSKNTPEFKVWFNLIHWPGFMCAYSIPDELKVKIERKLTSYDFKDYTKDIEGLVNFMNSRNLPTEDFNNVLAKFTALDKYREDNSRELFIKYYPEVEKFYSK